MFRFLKDLVEVDLDSFNTSNVTNMVEMFHECSNLTNLDLSNFDMSGVTNVNNMFYNSAITNLITPKVNPTTSITLPRTMYAQGNSAGITEITSTTPIQTTLKSTTW